MLSVRKEIVSRKEVHKLGKSRGNFKAGRLSVGLRGGVDKKGHAQ